MKKIALNIPGSSSDDIFNCKSQHNRDNCQLPFMELNALFRRNDLECHTLDYYKKNSSVPDAVINVDIPYIDPAFNMKNSYLIMCESEVIKPQNWNTQLHKPFKRIFTWQKALTHDDQYVFVNFNACILNPLMWSAADNKKLAVSISANKSVQHPLELYSARKNIIEWFEKNHPTDFDFYGFGWDRYRFETGPWRALNRLPYLGHWLAKRYQCYRGSVKSKYTTLNQYRFCICFENARDIKGYVTEKIFDAFTAGCIPVYWGAPDITDYVPSDCFIDYTKFNDSAELYTFLNTMSDEKYQHYLSAISHFMTSDAAEKFKPGCFVKTIVEVILRDLVIDHCTTRS